MQQLTVIVPVEAAATGVFDAGPYQWIIVSADDLADNEGTPEEVDVYNIAGSTFVVTADDNGDPVKLTPTRPSRVLAGGTVYQFTKDDQSATAHASGVYVQLGPGMNR